MVAEPVEGRRDLSRPRQRGRPRHAPLHHPAMALHLEEIDQVVARGAHAVLLLDRAGWHTTKKLVAPANITPLPLPARSPELKPVENLWQFMRDKWLGNRVFKSYADILDCSSPDFTDRGLARVPFGLLGGDVAQCRVDALPIVVALNVGEQVASSLVPGRPSSLVDELDLEGMEEALHRGVILAAAGPAHGGDRLHADELLSIGLGGVLAAAIRVAN